MGAWISSRGARRRQNAAAGVQDFTALSGIPAAHVAPFGLEKEEHFEQAIRAGSDQIFPMDEEARGDLDLQFVGEWTVDNWQF